jgi:serine/threonine protein kinase/Tfp pilus assembly protein PilF
MNAAAGTQIPYPLPPDLTGTKVGRFHIHSKLGNGGMGEVYYAEDTTLQRPVALKRMSHQLADHPEGRRQILKEAQRASILSSQHIAGIYDILDEPGEMLLVMEYVEGITLRRRLQLTGRLGVATSVQIACQCAEALNVAHQSGIVHRDIKPENIMLTPAGQAKVLDFGLARRLAMKSDTQTTVSGTSQSSLCAGTSGYTAPEVLLEHDLDARSDIFSLGVVFYEMLTGQHPFEAKKVIVTADHILHDDPPRAGELATDVPEELDHVVAKMLAKDPESRYKNAAELLEDLGRLRANFPADLQPKRRLKVSVKSGMYVVLTIVFLSFVLPILRGLWRPRDELPAKKYLAVLPFVPAVEDPQARAFCQGLTETLTAKLTQLTARHPLQVVSPGEIRAVSVASVQQARSHLGANLVLEGSFHQLGQKMRVTYNLVDSGTSRVLRADAISADADDPFALEDRVVESALRSLDMELSGQERKSLQSHGTTQPVAYDFYLRGRGYLQDYQKMENIDSAVELFQRALTKDANFALAYAGLGESYWQKYELTHDPQWTIKAQEACKRSNNSGEGAICLGIVYNGTGRYEQAAAEFQRALQSDPTNDQAYRGMASAYEHLNKLEDAERTYQQAINVRPDYWAGYNWLGTFFYHQARFEEGAKVFAQAAELAPDNVRAQNNLGGTYLAMGRYEDAISVFQKSVGINPSQDAFSNLGMAYLYLHHFPDAAHACEQAVQLDPRQYALWGNLGDVYYPQPERRKDALAAYRKAIELGGEQLKVNSRNSSLLSYLAVYHAMLGERGRAGLRIHEALTLTPSDPEVLLNAALVANQLGDEKQTFVWLRKSLQAGLSAVLVRDIPNFDNLHDKKMFQQLLREKISRS